MTWSRSPESAPGRDETVGFAARTSANLEHIVAAHAARADVHVVTQVVISLLGLVVFPFERNELLGGSDPLLEDLERSGWPRWEYVNGSPRPRTLSALVKHLRHATAHGNVAFSSDSRFLEEVVVSFSNTPRHGRWTWGASIRGDQLLTFCRRYVERVDARVG